MRRIAHTALTIIGLSMLAYATLLLQWWPIAKTSERGGEPLFFVLPPPAPLVNNNSNSNTSMAFASFLSFQGFEGCYHGGDFIQSVAKLGVSWRRLSSARDTMDMVLLVVDAPCRRIYSMQRLIDIGWRIVYVHHPVWYSPKTGERKWSWIAGNRYEHTAQLSKLLFWNMTQYRHILYMDADMLLLRDPMRLVYPMLPYANAHSLGMERCINTTICDTRTQRVCDTTQCMASGMLITPSAYELQRMRMHLSVVAFDREYQEQAFLINYWRAPYQRLVFKLSPAFSATPDDPRWFYSGAVHMYCDLKPWSTLLAKQNPALAAYWQGYCDNVECI